MATPAALRGKVKGPELGSFPLDHFRECKKEVADYYRCLEKHDLIAPMCRDEVRVYLQCRMERGLMTKTDVEAFGLPKTDFVPTTMQRETIRKDALRAGGTAAWLGPTYEAKFKAEELKLDDGYEAIKGTTTPAPAAMVMPGRTGDKRMSNRVFEVPTDAENYAALRKKLQADGVGK
jgi:cytochrome c oxidase assembly protein subunit 19